MINRISYFGAAIAAVLVAVLNAPIYDYIIIGASTLIALALVVSCVLKRSASQLLLALPWLTLVIVGQFSAYKARQASAQVLKNIPAVSSSCQNDMCILMKASDHLYSIGSARGFLVTYFPVGIFVKFNSTKGSCTLTTDYLFGREMVKSWACSVGERGGP